MEEHDVCLGTCENGLFDTLASGRRLIVTGIAGFLDDGVEDQDVIPLCSM